MNEMEFPGIKMDTPSSEEDSNEGIRSMEYVENDSSSSESEYHEEDSESWHQFSNADEKQDMADKLTHYPTHPSSFGDSYNEESQEKDSPEREHESKAVYDTADQDSDSEGNVPDMS